MDGAGTVPIHLQSKRKKANKQKKEKKNDRQKQRQWPSSCHDICRPQSKFREHVNSSRTPEFSVSCKQVKLLTFIGPFNTNIFSEYNQQDVTFLDLFISVRRSTCFRRFFRPSSGAQNCTFSVRYVQFSAPDDGRKTRLKNEERLTEIN